jgi:hypothetical protein
MDSKAPKDLAKADLAPDKTYGFLFFGSFE